MMTPGATVTGGGSRGAVRQSECSQPAQSITLRVRGEQKRCALIEHGEHTGREQWIDLFVFNQGSVIREEEEHSGE